ncbi:hypothetical protein G7B40_023780 [Aetokthonos hydrillicola Thurmond2011]|jgi:hypothetical protein|uniref:Uncharacterized protein n=1 Tax=Aetokthonos hydrillicola Thurmond2011 TaxID=2712845 RepID=A0AAP5I9T8_9CYAN|nr:hypothetical protein [Aetokthonos hydrillicola]MBO3460229.1 hypothetical protein [Aetokthonos hydrillicola CCALA 1050]MBW4586962.1 hypothetical protein [Aetokthonos hydrillicola CCALA 1050]MDR9897563.1 hypothetical protein [Aetokthonos hydrillicola Thurmond2011]
MKIWWKINNPAQCDTFKVRYGLARVHATVNLHFFTSITESFVAEFQ